MAIQIGRSAAKRSTIGHAMLSLNLHHLRTHHAKIKAEIRITTWIPSQEHYSLSSSQRDHQLIEEVQLLLQTLKKLIKNVKLA